MWVMEIHSDFKCHWEEALKHVRETIGDRDTYRRWIRSIVPLSYEKNTVLLGVADEFTAEWIKSNFEEVIVSSLKTVTDKTCRIKYETGHFSVCDEPAGGVVVKSQDVANKVDAGLDRSNGCYNFKSFVVGPENRIAYAAAMGMVDTKSSALSANPLFIYGGSGLGKTHLIQAVANEVKNKKNGMRTEYLSCEDLLNQYVEAIRTNRHHGFRNRFRKVNYLLIDDIHFLAKTEKLQEEFFNTFNSIYNENNKIILTSDKRPSEIHGLESRLVSRFSSGLTVEIEPFGEETRLAILRKKQEKQQIKFDDDILAFIARNIYSDVRVLEGALFRLVVYSSIDNCRMTVDLAKKILNDYLEQQSAKRVNIEAVQKAVAEFYDLRISDLTGRNRSSNIAVPRMVAMYLSRKFTEHSLPKIGEAFSKNHATVLHAFRKIEKDRVKSEKMNRLVSQIERKLHAG